jgi:hypothetical protein
LEWTESDHLKHSKFVGLRNGKDARGVLDVVDVTGCRRWEPVGRREILARRNPAHPLRPFRPRRNHRSISRSFFAFYITRPTTHAWERPHTFGRFFFRRNSATDFPNTTLCASLGNSKLSYARTNFE